MSSSVLFLHAGESTAGRMAVAVARRLLPPTVHVGSDTVPASALDPRVAAVMNEIGIGLWDEPAHAAPGSKPDRVVTISSDSAPRADLPDVEREHWCITEATQAEGSLEALRSARDEILRRVGGLARALRPPPALGIIGGSGFYDLPGVLDLAQVEVDTPFGAPSAPLAVGRLGERRVVFLARHGEGHRLLPSEVNARANLYALKRLGVTKVISVSAVGSLREQIEPGQVVLPRQFIDRTVGRPATFFGQGVVAHVSLADPVCSGLADTLAVAARGTGAIVHASGTYLCVEGPQFSTRAESALFRSWGADVVGMTNLPEARLAREAELCYATLALPTDYDCWRTRSEEVRVADVIATLLSNVEKARRVVGAAEAHIDPGAACVCRRSLDTALLTLPNRVDARSLVRLHAILERRLYDPAPVSDEAAQ